MVVLLSQMKEAGFLHPLCGIVDNSGRLPKPALCGTVEMVFRKILCRSNLYTCLGYQEMSF